MKAIWFLTTSVVMLLGACARISDREVPGIYAASYENGVDQLTLLPSGDYSHVVDIAGGRISLVGRWDIETLDGEDIGLTFYGFRFRSSATSLKAAGVWHVEPKRSLNGRVKLCFDPDTGACFVRE